MASGYRSGGVDFDDLFDPDVMGDGPSAAGLRSGGTPLKYAALAYGSKRADVGYRQGGSDVSNLWAAKGTAQYVSDGGLPPSLSAAEEAGQLESITVAVEFRLQRNGFLGWTGGGGTWAGGGGTVGDAYDTRFDVTAGPAGFATRTGSEVGTWLQVNTTRSCGLTVTKPAGIIGNRSGTMSVRWRVRRRSTGEVLVDRSVAMSVLAATSA